jgi:hypothetical protein
MASTGSAAHEGVLKNQKCLLRKAGLRLQPWIKEQYAAWLATSREARLIETRSGSP